MINRRVFISSTVYDLADVRHEIKGFINSASIPDVQLIAETSEDPDFPVDATSRASRHSYDICLERLAACNYAVFIIDARYGRAIIPDNGHDISITHLEFRTSVRLCTPRLVFVNKATWDARLARRRGESQTHVPPDQVGVFDLIDEIQHSVTNWLSFYDSVDDIKVALQQCLFRLDDSAFVSDLDMPEGQPVSVGATFIKSWQIRNNGLIRWTDRTLCEDNFGASGLTPKHRCIPIPDTLPGEAVTLSVELTAPPYTGTCKSVWKMFDKDGAYCFPQKPYGIWCMVHITNRLIR